jgi:citrate synthase
MGKQRYLSAAAAAQALGVRPATLYAYVSRGQVRSEVGPDKRARRYYADDIERLVQRKTLRRDPGQVASGALHAGMPVMDSAISLISDTALYYRGHDVADLAREQNIEAVASLVWLGELEAEVSGLRQKSKAAPTGIQQLSGLRGLERCEAMQALLPLAAAEDLAAYDTRPEAVARVGARILHLLVGVIVGENTDGGAAEGSIAAVLQRAWAPKRTKAQNLIDAALILCADHELNASAFTARCVASTGATPYAAVGAGLAALSGPKHGGSAHRVDRLFDEAESLGAKEAVARRLKQGEMLHGFGHVIYRGMDPRAVVLIAMLEEYLPRAKALKTARALVDEVGSVLDLSANIDLALTALTRSLGRGPGDTLALFALGRTVGWIGHISEEYANGRLIRPRARYTGTVPDDGGI